MTLQLIEPMGNETYIHFDIDGNECMARIRPIENLKVGETTSLYFETKEISYFHSESGIKLA